MKQLEARYWNHQKKLHPDRFHGSSTVEREFSAQQASNINIAYNTLKQPHLRAKYMLQLMGVPFGEGTDTPVDPALLMEIMEIREQIEACSSTQGLKDLQQENDVRMQDTLLAAAAFFNSGMHHHRAPKRRSCCQRCLRVARSGPAQRPLGRAWRHARVVF